MVLIATAKWYGQGLLSVASKQSDWVNDTIVVTLHTSAYTPNQDTDTAATSELATANGYTAGGITLAGKSISYDAASNEVRFISTTNPSWTLTGTITGRYAVVKDSTTGKTLGYVDNVTDYTAGTSLTITWDATGVLKITAA